VQECVLIVDVERIGHFDPVTSGTLTPRSFQAAPLKHDQLSKLLATLSKVSGGIDRETESNAQACHPQFSAQISVTRYCLSTSPQQCYLAAARIPPTLQQPLVMKNPVPLMHANYYIH
jgi:hypothetical protein